MLIIQKIEKVHSLGEINVVKVTKNLLKRPKAAKLHGTKR